MSLTKRIRPFIGRNYLELRHLTFLVDYLIHLRPRPGHRDSARTPLFHRCLWHIERVGTPNTAFLDSAMAVLETKRLYLHNHRLDPRLWGLILFSRSTVTPPTTLKTYSISPLASIPLVAGSDIENVGLEVPISSTLYLVISGTGASSNFLEKNGGGGNESGGQVVLASYGRVGGGGYQAIFVISLTRLPHPAALYRPPSPHFPGTFWSSYAACWGCQMNNEQFLVYWKLVVSLRLINCILAPAKYSPTHQNIIKLVEFGLNLLKTSQTTSSDPKIDNDALDHCYVPGASIRDAESRSMARGFSLLTNAGHDWMGLDLSDCCAFSKPFRATTTIVRSVKAGSIVSGLEWHFQDRKGGFGEHSDEVCEGSISPDVQDKVFDKSGRRTEDGGRVRWPKYSDVWRKCQDDGE
ncbi:hypothetical protein K438DRAFT_1773285 [Mycena galopus ATCC 62051]|nr:hypothetical protein K438DRAFT_1773285 [Mycena galopus ATCC 62051]